MVPTILRVGELIERARAVTAVRATVGAAVAGSGRLTVLRGPAGIGKSAVLTHASEVARTSGLTVLRSAATPVSATLSDGVVRDWLTPLLREAHPGVAPFDGPAAALVVETALDLPTLHYALSWLLERLTAGAPVLLVVDDIHWADVRSLDVIDLLSARLHGLPVSVLAALRTGEPTDASAALGRVVARAEIIDLEPLSPIGVEQLRREVEETPNVARLTTDELHRRTGGVPFLVQELLRAPSPEEAPRGVVESVRERLTRLGQGAVDLARATAVLDAEATFDALAELTGRTVADLADPLELLTDAGIVTLGMWEARIAHPLVAEAVRSTMTPSQRSRLHRAAAAYLAALERPTQVVAGHLLHTLPDEDATVVDVLQRAGGESLAAGAPSVAARQLLRAVGETRPQDTDPALVVLAASAHLAAGDRETGSTLWNLALDRAAGPAARARLLTQLCDAHLAAGEVDDASQALDRAATELETAGLAPEAAERHGVRVRRALVRCWCDGQPDEPGGVAGEVQDAEASDPALAHTRQLTEAFDLAARNDGRDRAVGLAGRALAGVTAPLRDDAAVGDLWTATAVLRWGNAYDASLQVLEGFLTEARREGSVPREALARCGRGLVRLEQGRLGEAVGDFEAAMGLRERGWPGIADAAATGAAVALLALGRLEEATRLEPLLRSLAQRGRFVDAQAAAVAGMVRAAHDQHEAALVDFAHAARLMDGRADNGAIVPWRELSAWSLVATGRGHEAAAVGREALEHAETWGAPRAVAIAQRTMARLTGDSDEAEVLLREALQGFAAASAADHRARTHLDLARLLLDGTDAQRREAVGLMRAALDYARAEQALPLIRRATTMLARSGEPMPDLVGLREAGLTPGERRVAELAAAGATNREIATRLFVTVKAVEWHLSHAYRKLGISSRSELPAVLYGESGPSSSSLR